MSWKFTTWHGLTVPPALGPSGFHDIGAGHQASHPGRTGSGIVHHPLVALPGGKVFDPLGSTVAVRDSIDVTAQGYLLDTTRAGMDIQIATWNAAVGVTDTLTRQDSAGNTNTATARLVSADMNRGYEDQLIQPIQLIWTLTGLPWNGAAQSQAPTVGATTVTTSFTAVNNGNVPQTKVQISLFQSGGGTITAFQFQVNGVGFNAGKYLLYSGSISPTGFLASLFLDTGTLTIQKNVTGTLTDDYAHFTPPTLFETWVSIPVGSTTCLMAVTYTGSTPTMLIQYHDAWN